MKRYPAADILDHVLIPLTAYLSIGLIIINLYNFSFNHTYFIVWGIMAGIIMGIKEYFANKTMSFGIGIYAAVVVIWFGLFAGDNNKIHAAMAVLGLCAIFLLQKLFMYKIIKVLSGFAVITALICLEFADISFSRGIIALAVFLFLNAVSETLSFFYQGNVNSFIIIYALTAMLTVIMPVSEEPYDWAFVIKTVQTVNKMIENIVNEIQYQWGGSGLDGIFKYGYTGYSDSPVSFSDGIEDRNIIQLMLQGKRTKRNFYLKGNVCDSYTGDSWETAVMEETMNYQTDTLITLYAVFSHVQDKDELRKFMEVYEHEITLQNIRTRSLFYPVKLLNITAQNVQSDGDNLRTEKINERGYSYSYRFVDIDYADSRLTDIIKNSDNITYNEETYNLIFDKMKEYYGIDLDKKPFNEFLEAVSRGQKAVAEQYTIPGNAVSNNVRMLADDITKDCTNDYEKCKALEAYLYQYTYNKRISVPDNVNVLDWFLFDGREGYCSHYATALAAMLRCEGIPSRVAEGFLVDYKNYIDIYNYSISSQTAHMWVEAYIEGFGWIRLEPTALNAANANAVWYADLAEEEKEPEEIINEIAEPDQSKEAENVWLLMLMVLGGMAVIIFIILLTLLTYKRNQIRKSNDPDVILPQLLSLLGKKYSPKEDDETVREYFRRISVNGQIPEEIQGNLAAILGLMEAYWYGQGSINENDIKAMKEIRDGLS